MNEIDQKFEALAAEIRGLSEKEIYYRIRKHFDQVPREIDVYKRQLKVVSCIMRL